MKTKRVIIVVLIIAAVAAVVGYSYYNKPHRDAGKEAAAYTIDAIDLFNAFIADESGANEKYVNLVIEVSGTVIDSKNTEDGTATLMLEAGDPIFGVKCKMTHPLESNDMRGEQVKVKGICSGFNMDVELMRCVIVNQ